jgi:hypothetical protein
MLETIDCLVKVEYGGRGQEWCWVGHWKYVVGTDGVAGGG